MAPRPRIPPLPRCRPVVIAAALLAGCDAPPTGTTDPPAKLRLERIVSFYRYYQADRKQPPPDEKALKEYVRGLPAEKKQGFGMTDDLDQLFVSPRDGKPFAVRYKVRIDPGAGSEAVAWEKDGQNGGRFVALMMGYVQEYADADFKGLKKK